jgi:amidohydrolase
MTLISKIQELSEKYYDEVVRIRRHLHQHPELSYKEYQTSEFIKGELEKAGLNYRTIFNTGITGELTGSTGGPVIALRADIDALPVQEKNDLSYKSLTNGIMHACGHDVHTASLLGTLKILNELKDYISGTIKFIFQPAEEKLPGGAKQLIEAGVLEDPKPDFIIGQHVYPDLPAGTIGLKPGPYMASTDEIFLTIRGKGGHGALPHKLNDTVLAASQIICALHQNINRYAPANIPTVISFGKIIGNGATNVIPDEVSIDGTFRTMSETWRAKAHQLIKETAEAIGATHGAECLINIKKGYPVLDNDEAMITKISEFSGEYLGENNIKNLEIRMTAEDFAYYTQKIPGAFFRLGTGNTEKGINAPLHSSTFNIDEMALKTGMGNMAWLAINFLKASEKSN